MLITIIKPYCENVKTIKIFTEYIFPFYLEHVLLERMMVTKVWEIGVIITEMLITCSRLCIVCTVASSHTQLLICISVGQCIEWYEKLVCWYWVSRYQIFGVIYSTNVLWTMVMFCYLLVNFKTSADLNISSLQQKHESSINFCVALNCYKNKYTLYY